VPAGARPAFLHAGQNRPSRPKSLSYLEYHAWLQQVLPESALGPPGGAGTEAAAQVSGLELLRLLSGSKASGPPRGVSALTPAEVKLADEGLWGGGSPDEVLASRFSVNLTRRQLECLRPGEWLNDEVINFYFKLLQERSSNMQGAPSCWFTNSFFWPKLSGNKNKEYSYKEVRRWTTKAKVDVFALDYIIFPMNIADTHWAVGAVDLKERGFRYFDSMTSKPHPNFVPFLQRYLNDEHKSKKGAALVGFDEWGLLEPISPVPQQSNGYDCGVFTCFFADYFSAGRGMEFDQEDMPNLRLRLAARVMRADENWEPT